MESVIRKFWPSGNFEQLPPKNGATVANNFWPLGLTFDAESEYKKIRFRRSLECPYPETVWWLHIITLNQGSYMFFLKRFVLFLRVPNLFYFLFFFVLFLNLNIDGKISAMKFEKIFVSWQNFCSLIFIFSIFLSKFYHIFFYQQNSSIYSCCFSSKSRHFALICYYFLFGKKSIVLLAILSVYWKILFFGPKSFFFGLEFFF